MEDFDCVQFPPVIKIVVQEEKQMSHGWHKLFQRTVIAEYPDGKQSAPFPIDSVLRGDAVAILAHFESKGQRYVYLRSCVRPAIMLRDYSTSKLMETAEVGNQYEIPAGVVEAYEIGANGLILAAARELEEEIGFTIEPEHFKFLGKRSFPSVGISSERIFYLEVEVKPWLKKEPTLDGHPLEEGGKVLCVRLKDALECFTLGYMYDSKTEIGLNRLAHKFPDRKQEEE